MKQSFLAAAIAAALGVPATPALAKDSPHTFTANVELGAYHSGNNAENRYCTDLTGHDNSKNAFLVDVKRTF